MVSYYAIRKIGENQLIAIYIGENIIPSDFDAREFDALLDFDFVGSKPVSELSTTDIAWLVRMQTFLLEFESVRSFIGAVLRHLGFEIVSESELPRDMKIVKVWADEDTD